MKKVKLFKTKLTLIVLLIMLLICSLVRYVSARDNFAFSVATQSGINTVQDMNDAANAYYAAGYHSYGLTDPSTQTLWENLYADVQFFASHGDVNNVQFAESGIVVGNTGYYDCGGTTKQLIGTNAVHWDADTILVTYSSCNSAGANNNNDTNSITCKTAEKGATVAVGFRGEINTGSATNWDKRYNQKLGEGYGVIDAVNYASSFTYLDPDVKKVQIWHHGDANMKIGKYRSVGTGLGEERNILNKSIRQVVNNDIDSITSVIKSVYPNFNINNYEIENIDGTKTSLVNDNSTISDTNYIDLRFKIGDFYTEAGYTVELKNNAVTAIYDNNIDMVKQETLVNDRISTYAKLTQERIEELKEDAKEELSERYNDIVDIQNDGITYKYYYDLNTDKKYIIFTIPNTIGNEEIKGRAFSDIKIEI